MILDDIEKEVGKNMPIAYRKLLETIDDFEYIEGLDYPEVDSKTSWFFWGKARLAEMVHIDGAVDRPAWNLLASFVEIDKKYRHRNQAPSNLGPVDYDRLNNSIVIAEDNGDYLYFDVDNGFSMWVYWHDSGEVIKISESFDVWAVSMVRDS